ncbi:hypothetical protein [Streptomyces sp. NBC_01190]|uniref:hypothetical protein n=1 Tax=Streptomyces sp. NBC_01190 TaxID=2903767 RepID=UPI003870222F|nr:hypothetical protein OG519_33620 [Streptomyces sp. NBC_01190]
MDDGAIPAALRQPRATAVNQPPGDVAPVLGRTAAAIFDDLRKPAEALTAGLETGRAPYDFGYACVEGGLPDLAIPAWREALRHHPGEMTIMRDLVTASESEGRHLKAVETLSRHESDVAAWPDRYLLVFNADDDSGARQPAEPHRDGQGAGVRISSITQPGPVRYGPCGMPGGREA